MTMIFQRILTRGISQLSYLVGDDTAGRAAVIDPRPDVDVYLEASRRLDVAITHVFETHVHADFMSGARELVDRLGGGARLCVSGEGDAEYGFDVERIHDGDRFELGSVVLRARHTPGHTPEHLAFEVADREDPDDPWGIFTGDSLFAGSAGRPDLLGDEETHELTRKLFDTLRNVYLAYDDGVALFPCHGAGSACGADIGDRPMGTIGRERRTNRFLRLAEEGDAGAFDRLVRESAPPEPHHYRHLKKVNAAGPPILGRTPPVPGLTPDELAARVEQGDAQLLDTRQMFAFGGGHVAGALNIGLRPELAVWAGQMLDHDRPILLVVEDASGLDELVRQLLCTGFTRFAGYLVGGMTAWCQAGRALERLPQMTVHQVNERPDGLQVLDVRSPAEWKAGRVPGAVHHYLGDLRDGDGSVEGLDPERPLAVYCGSGYRASIAASLLKRRGFDDVRNVPGSWSAWTEAGYEVER